MRAAVFLCLTLAVAGCTASPNGPTPVTEVRPPVRTKVVVKVVERVVYVVDPAESIELRQARADLAIARADLEKDRSVCAECQAETDNLRDSLKPTTLADYRHCQSLKLSSPCESKPSPTGTKCEWISSEDGGHPACLPKSLRQHIKPSP